MRFLLYAIVLGLALATPLAPSVMAHDACNPDHGYARVGPLNVAAPSSLLACVHDCAEDFQCGGREP